VCDFFLDHYRAIPDALATLDRSVGPHADGAGSTISLNALTTFDAALVDIVETNGGVITRP